MNISKKIQNMFKIACAVLLLVNASVVQASPLIDITESNAQIIERLIVVSSIAAVAVQAGCAAFDAISLYFKRLQEEKIIEKKWKEHKEHHQSSDNNYEGTVIKPGQIKENFKSVEGAQEAKEELGDVVEFLKNPEKYSRLGAKVPRGVLLSGEPGNGKTLLARAVAGEANCAFIAASGSEFVQQYVGIGAERVRALFNEARKYKTAIIFIDEIDAIGMKRSSTMDGGDKEYAQTINQLLTEMDGFNTKDSNVIVIGATNRTDILDSALLRPGRFDRQVQVPYPDLQSREKILRLHAKKVTVDAVVDFKQLAHATAGFSGAELANLINEAALLASKSPEKNSVSQADFEEARDKIIMGHQWKSSALSPEEKRVTAYHEAGHTLLIALQRDLVKPLHKVTILPRGRSMGATYSMPEGEEQFSRSREQMLADIRVALAGRAAEEYKFACKSTGASNDFEQATRLARYMVCKMGMSDEMGEVIYDRSFEYSQKTAEKIDATVEAIIRRCMQETKQIIEKNADKLEAITQALLEKETLDKQGVYSLLGIA